MKIVLLGSTGNVGKVLLKEFSARAFDVTTVVRKARESTFGERIVLGNINNYEAFEQEIEEGSIIVSSMGPKFDQEEEFAEIMKNLIAFAKLKRAARLIVVGGAGSLYVAENKRLVDTLEFPKEWKPIANAHLNALNLLEESQLNWTYFSPAAFFEPGEKLGNYRIGSNELILDKNGNSKISFGDYAEALAEELNNPKNEKKQMTIGY